MHAGGSFTGGAIRQRIPVCRHAGQFLGARRKHLGSQREPFRLTARLGLQDCGVHRDLEGENSSETGPPVAGTKERVSEPDHVFRPAFSHAGTVVTHGVPAGPSWNVSFASQARAGGRAWPPLTVRYRMQGTFPFWF